MKMLKTIGIQIVYIQATQGNNIIDPYFKTNYENAKASNLKVGFYHFLTATSISEAEDEASFFVSAISNLEPDCRLAMDFEIFNRSFKRRNKLYIICFFRQSFRTY